jgi:hypothetical protein
MTYRGWDPKTGEPERVTDTVMEGSDDVHS